MTTKSKILKAAGNNGLPTIYAQIIDYQYFIFNKIILVQHKYNFLILIRNY